jgi:hypothetical protein
MTSTRNLLTASALVVTLAASASGIDSLEFSVGPGTHEEAGFGELSPGSHDLSVAYTPTQGEFMYSTFGLTADGYSYWSMTQYSPTRHAYKMYGVEEDGMTGGEGGGTLQQGYYNIIGSFTTKYCSLRLPCFSCLGPSGPICDTSGPGYCSLTQEGELEILPGQTLTLPIHVSSGPGTITIFGGTEDLEIQNLDGSPFTSAWHGSGNYSTTVLIHATEEFDENVQLMARFLPANGTRDSQDVITIIRGTPLLADIDVDSNNDGDIDESDDPIEQGEACVVPAGEVVPVLLTASSPEPGSKVNIQINGPFTLWLDESCSVSLPPFPQSYHPQNSTSVPRLPSLLYLRGESGGFGSIELFIENQNGSRIAEDVVAVAAQAYDYAHGELPHLYSAPEVDAFTTGAGTSPRDGSYVSPDQEVLLQLTVVDADLQRFVPPGGAYQLFGVDGSFPGTFTAVVSLTNATFQPSGAHTRLMTFENIGNGTWSVGGQKLRVDPDWTGEGMVTVSIGIRDEILIPPNKRPLANGVTVESLQDPDTTLMLNWSMPAADGFPLTQSGVRQEHQDYSTSPRRMIESPVFSEQATAQLTVWYLYGPDRNGAANATANYEGITVNEFFGAFTTNVDKSWMRAEIVAAYPATHTADDIINAEFGENGGGLVNFSTFTISSADITSDSYGMIQSDWLADNLLSAFGASQQLVMEKPQWYECPPGTVIGRNTLRSRRIATQPFPTYWSQIRREAL